MPSKKTQKYQRVEDVYQQDDQVQTEQFFTQFLPSLEQILVQINELSAGIVELLGIYGIHVPNRRRDPIVFEETKGDFSSDGEGEFQDKENYVNFDEPPKFDDDQGFIEDTVVVFGDEGSVVTVIPMSTSAQLQVVVSDARVNQCSIKVVAKKEVKFAAQHFWSFTANVINFNYFPQHFLGHIDSKGLASVTDDVILFPIIESVKTTFEEKIIQDQKSQEGTKIRGRIFVNEESMM